jgi:hypothetical protein
MRTQWNDAEDEALHGLPWMTQLVYLRGIRPFMDFASGVVGIKRGISLKSIAEVLHVEHGQGRREYGDPTPKAIRYALELLQREGLIERIGADRSLVFRLPLADTDQSVSDKWGRRRADVGQTKQGTAEPTNDKGSPEKQGRRGADPDPEKWGTPPESVIRTDNLEQVEMDRAQQIAKSSRGSRLSILDLPDDWRAFANLTRPDLDPEFCWQKFRDYWVAVPGQKGSKLDWLATWRNFIRSERKVNGHDRESAFDRRSRINAELIEAGRRAFESEMG